MHLFRLLTLFCSMLLFVGCGSPQHSVLDSPPLASAAAPDLQDDSYPLCTSMQFSDDGQHLLFWTRERMVHYALTEKGDGLELKELSHVKLPPSPSVEGRYEGFFIEYAAFFPLYEATELIPPAFAGLKAAVLSERKLFVENKAFAEDKKKAFAAGFRYYDEPALIGSFIYGEQEMLLCGKKLILNPVALRGSRVQQEFSAFSYASAGTSISLDKEHIVSVKEDYINKTESFVFLHKGAPCWDIRKADHTDHDTEAGNSLQAYASMSPTGKYALLRFFIGSYIMRDYVPLVGRASIGYHKDKYVYLLVDVQNKTILHKTDRLEFAGRGYFTPVVAIDERNRRIAVYNDVEDRIEIQSF